MKNLTFVIFGGTGDLAKRKLAPALNSIANKGNLKIRIIGVGRTKYTKEDYEKHFDIKDKNKNLQIDYYKGNVSEKETMKEFHSFVHKTKADEIIYYLATSYNLFSDTFKIIKDCKKKNIKLMIEKPFGKDFESWTKLNIEMKKYFTREQIFRVDHYVAKETIDNLLLLRLSNPFFENTWNGNFVDKIRIVVKETIGVENRLDYYDDSGAIKDMIQNHLLQTLALVIMNPPLSMAADDIREEKTKALKNLEFKKAELGQYTGYKAEVKKKLNKETNTETYAKVELTSKNKRWKGTKIILETGKKLDKKEAYIELEYKKEPCLIYCDFRTAPNRLKIEIQPMQNITLSMNTKLPGETPDIEPVQMTFCPTCEFRINSPESYETIISECIKGEKRIFIRGKELDASWKITDEIIKKTKSVKPSLYK